MTLAGLRGGQGIGVAGRHLVRLLAAVGLLAGAGLGLAVARAVSLPVPIVPATVPARPAALTHSAGAELSREQAIALAERRYGARVVRADVLLQQDGRRVYVFRLLSAGGKVWTVRLDAQSGSEVP